MKLKGKTCTVSRVRRKPPHQRYEDWLGTVQEGFLAPQMYPLAVNSFPILLASFQATVTVSCYQRETYDFETTQC